MSMVRVGYALRSKQPGYSGRATEVRRIRESLITGATPSAATAQNNYWRSVIAKDPLARLTREVARCGIK